MVRFIFICMGVVAVAVITIAGQGIYEGISTAQDKIAARNEQLMDQAVETVAVIGDEAAEPTAEELNNIMPAAGDFDANDTFQGGFTGVAPAALQDEPVQNSAAPEVITDNVPQ